MRVTGVPLDDVLNAIADQSDAEIRGSVLAPRDVTTDFENVPVQDGLHRILGNQNFLLTYRQDGTLRTLALLGGTEEAPPRTRVVKAGSGTGQPSTLAELMQRSVPVPAGSKLARFLGQDTATLQQLGDVVRGQDDVGLRMEAIRAGVGGIDSQQDLRDAVVKALQGSDDAAIQSAARGFSGDRARETVSQIATLSHTTEIRTRMLGVLKNHEPGSVGSLTAGAPLSFLSFEVPVPGDRGVVLGEIDVELVRAVAAGHEVEVGHRRRIHGGFERGPAGIGDGRRRESRHGVGVVRSSRGRGRARDLTIAVGPLVQHRRDRPGAACPSSTG